MNRVLREFFRAVFFLFALMAGYGAIGQTIHFSVASKMCRGIEYTFSDKSSLNGKTVASQNWTFPNSSEPNATGSPVQGVSFAVAGNYTITLKDSFTDGSTATGDSVITILPVAYPYFYIQNGGVCDDSSVTITDTTNTTAESASSYAWNFGDTTTATGANPGTHKYNGPGAFNVSLTVTSTNGCVISVSHPANIYDFPILDTIQLFNTCIGNATLVHYHISYKFSSVQSVFFNFNTADVPPKGGIFSLSDTVTINNLYNPNLLDEIQKDSFPVYDPVDTTKIDSFQPTRDTVTTAQYATFYHTYLDTGTYNVQVSINTIHGCNVNNIKVKALVMPTPHDSFTVTTACRNTGNVITDYSTVGHPSHITKVYFIYEGDSMGPKGQRVPKSDTIYAPFAGKFPIRHIYPQSDVDTSYRLVGYAFSETGCIDSMVRKAYVYSIPHDTFVAGNGCPYFPDVFVDKSTPVTKDPYDTVHAYKWNFGDPGSGALNTADSAQPAHIYKKPGNYTITDTTYTPRGCKAFSTETITIYKQPVTGITSPATICVETSNIYNYSMFQDKSTPPAGGTIAGWWWNFGTNTDSTYSYSKNPLVSFMDTGKYEIKHVATTNEGCTDTDSVSIHVIASPSALFNTPGGGVCFGQSTPFTDTSTGTITSYYWDFGDNSATSTAKDPSHLYSQYGSYFVVHAVVSPSGCSDTIRKKVTVSAPPKAYIKSTSTTSVCAGGTATFIDSSSANAAFGKWDFGDGKSSPGRSVNHIYTTAGAYTVTDIVTTANGCSADTTLQIVVNPLPVAAIALPVSVCAKDSASFIDKSQSIDSYTQTWDFGDNTAFVKGTKYPAHIYENTGTYKVTIYDTTSPYGCGDSSSQRIYIYPGPSSSFYLNSGYSPYVCINSPATFINTSTTTSSYRITGYTWFFGDRDTSDSQNPDPHLYSVAGNDTVKLVAINNLGCYDTSSYIIKVSPLPQPYYTSSAERCSGYPVLLSASNALPNDPVGTGNWTWYVNGQFSQTGATPSAFNFQPGPNTVKLVAVDGHGCAGDSTTIINIYSTPVPNFNSPVVCQGQPSLLQDASTLQFLGLGDSITSWYWQFDDSTTDTGMKVSHIFQNAGTHYVTLTDTTNHQCTQSVTRAVIVNATPVARIVFEPNPVNINNPHIEFYDSSTNAIHGLNWWDLGDGYYRTDSSTVSHSYDTAGHYIVRLAVQNADGCADTLSDTIWVEPVFTMWIPDAFTPNGDGINDVWKPVSQGVVTYELEIINIWGGEVFRTSDPNASWIGDDDGNGKICPDGMYIYRIVCTDIFDEVIHTYKGNITLIK